jgi:hypothetical protein
MIHKTAFLLAADDGAIRIVLICVHPSNVDSLATSRSKSTMGKSSAEHQTAASGKPLNHDNIHWQEVSKDQNEGHINNSRVSMRKKPPMEEKESQSTGETRSKIAESESGSVLVCCAVNCCQTTWN